MTEAEKQIHIERRAAHVERILANVSSYMVCDQCLSISKTTARVCPICHAYCWDKSAERVTSTAKIIRQNPIPVTSPFIPRL